MRSLYSLAFGVLISWGVCAAGLAADDEEPEDEPGSAGGAEGAEGKDGPPPPPTPKKERPPSPNLKIPADLPEKAHKSLEEAIAAFKDAEKAESGNDKILTKAIDKLRTASTKAPKSSLPHYYLGIAYQIKKNYPEAKRSLEKALKLSPSFHEALLELGDVAIWQKNVKGSLAHYEKALELQPKYTDAMERKALALIRLGRFKEADLYFKQAQSIEPSDDRKRFMKQLDVEIKGPTWEKTYKEETENYQVFTSVSQDFAKQMSQHAELINRAYSKVFSDVPKTERKFPIWIYPDRETFLAAGAPPWSGGYYDPTFRRLVLYKYPATEKTILVLYHEAFHQYLQDYLEHAPAWFNEGVGEYFSPFQYSRRGKEERMLAKPNVGRLRDAQIAIDAGMCTPPQDLMVMSQAEMYKKGAVHYAQSWAMIYFMIESKKSTYKDVLVNYFRALHKGMDINQAYQATFGKVDMVKFDQEWKGYIKGLQRG